MIYAILLGIDTVICSFMRGLVTGDSNIANDGLRRFFEQKFHEGSESYVVDLGIASIIIHSREYTTPFKRGLRQYAMLNLARMYFLRRELAACRKVGSVVIASSYFILIYGLSLDFRGSYCCISNSRGQ